MICEHCKTELDEDEPQYGPGRPFEIEGGQAFHTVARCRDILEVRLVAAEFTAKHAKAMAAIADREKLSRELAERQLKRLVDKVRSDLNIGDGNISTGYRQLLADIEAKKEP